MRYALFALGIIILLAASFSYARQSVDSPTVADVVEQFVLNNAESGKTYFVRD